MFKYILFFFLLSFQVINAQLTNGLVHYWKLDETSGTNLVDEKGTRNMTAVNGALVNQTGKLNKCVAFDGSNDYLNIGAGLTAGLSEFTLNFWVNQTTTDQYGGIFEESYGGNWQCVVEADKWETRDASTGTGGAVNNTLTMPPIRQNQFTMITLLYSVTGQVKQIYENGTLYATTSTSVDALTSERDVYRFGSNLGGWGDYYTGKIDEIGFWNRALTGAEISQLYNTGNAFAHPFTVPDLIPSGSQILERRNVEIIVYRKGAVVYPYRGIKTPQYYAHRWYFSNTGSDALNGHSPSTPLLSANNLPGLISDYDTIYFNADDTFYISPLILTGRNHLVFGKYGTGQNPYITGAVKITNFSQSGNTWSATFNKTLDNRGLLPFVYINGQLTQASHEDTFLTFRNFTSIAGNVITDNNHTYTVNALAGGNVVYMENFYSWKTCKIVSNTAHTITINVDDGVNYDINDVNYDHHNRTYFALFNLPSFADQENEWWLASNTININRATRPTNVLIASSDSLLNFVNSHYITFNDITFFGAYRSQITLQSSSDFTYNNCQFEASDYAGVKLNTQTTNLAFYNTTFKNCGFALWSARPGSDYSKGSVDYLTFDHCYFEKNGGYNMFNTCDQRGIAAIQLAMSGHIQIKYCYFYKNAIPIWGQTLSGELEIGYNYFEENGLWRADIGCIYLNSTYDITRIHNNLFYNNHTFLNTTYAGNLLNAEYYDETTAYITSDTDVIVNNQSGAYHFHMCGYNTVNHALIVNAAQRTTNVDWNAEFLFNEDFDNEEVNWYKYNTLQNSVLALGTSSTSAFLNFYDVDGNGHGGFLYDAMYQIDYNRYFSCKMTSTNLWNQRTNGVYQEYNFSGFKSSTGFDTHSSFDGTQYTNEMTLYNRSNTFHTFTLTYSAVDINGNSVTSVTLNPFSGAYLRRNGAITITNPENCIIKDDIIIFDLLPEPTTGNTGGGGEPGGGEPGGGEPGQGSAVMNNLNIIYDQDYSDDTPGPYLRSEMEADVYPGWNLNNTDPRPDGYWAGTYYWTNPEFTYTGTTNEIRTQGQTYPAGKLEIINENGNKFLRHNIVAYERGTYFDHGWTAYTDIGGQDEVYQRCWIRFPSNMLTQNKKIAGKLFGMSHPTGTGPGYRPPQNSGFTFLIMFENGDDPANYNKLYIYSYIYYPEMDCDPEPSCYGEGFKMYNYPMYADQWYEIIQHVKLNTGSNHDGFIEYYINGNLVGFHSGYRFRTDNSVKILYIYPHSFFGGDDLVTSIFDTYFDFDDMTVGVPQ